MNQICVMENLKTNRTLGLMEVHLLDGDSQSRKQYKQRSQ